MWVSGSRPHTKPGRFGGGLGWIVATLVALVICGNLPVIAQNLGVGRIQGADALNVRRGPGIDHPSLGTVKRGERVQIEAVVSDWLLIRNQSLTGYVRADYVALPDGTTVTKLAAAATPTTAADTEAVPLDADDEALSAASASRPGGSSPVPAGQTPPVVTRLAPEAQEEMRRILTLTEELHREMERRRSLPRNAEHSDSSLSMQSGLGLLGLGGVIGFFVGAILGRQQERSGRSRVRF